MARIFIIDDEAAVEQRVVEELRAEGHEVVSFREDSPALDEIQRQSPELVVMGWSPQNSGTQGLDALRKARTLNPPAEVIVCAALGSVETAVEAMKLGAYEFLAKPVSSDALIQCMRRALAYHRALAENHYLKKQLRERYQLTQIVGASPQIQAVLRRIERVAETDSTVLILGESGTGKELVARALHFNSRRQFAPFIPVNCAALPEASLESELFGHRKGAFPGALQDRKGFFEEAEGGTLFLDEIGSLPLAVQSRMLRVLQDGELRRVGDSAPTHVNVRVLAATHEPLEEKIKEGAFREDLFYRLNVIPIELPALRERPEDIPLLVAHALRNKVSPRTGHPLRITRRAMETLVAHSWPGNVRELENVLERAATLCDADLIRVADLPVAVQASAPESARIPPGTPDETDFLLSAAVPASPGLSTATDPELTPPSQVIALGTGPLLPLREYLREQEVMHLNRALAQAAGSKEKAAEVLGISLATLYRKLAGDSGS